MTLAMGTLFVADDGFTARRGLMGIPSLTTTAFSEDSTLMAAGFSESYIRLWNLKGEKLRSMRSDFDPKAVTDCL
jgi:hypothetical protein